MARKSATETPGTSDTRPWSRLGPQASNLIRRSPLTFIRAADWFMATPERDELRRLARESSLADGRSPAALACERATMPSPIPKPGERWHGIACLLRAWSEVASKFIHRPEAEQFDDMTDADAAIVVLLTALSKDADFDGSDLGLDLRWRSKPGEPEDGRDWQPWGAVDVYLPMAKLALDRTSDRVREREEAGAREHPVLRMASALQALTNSFANISIFEHYAKLRDDAVRRHHNCGNEMHRMANTRLCQPGPAGQTFEQSLARAVSETAEAGAWMARPPLVNVSAAMLRTMRTDLHLIQLQGQRVRRALVNGASKRLDGVIAPNALGQPPSIELHQRLSDTQGLWGHWFMIFNCSQVQMKDEVEQLKHLAGFFRHFTRNLWAAIEADGPDKPAPPVVVTPDVAHQIADVAARTAMEFNASRAGDLNEPSRKSSLKSKVCLNARAMDMLTKVPGMAGALSSEWANRLGCAETSVRNLKAWKLRGKGTSHKTVSMTKELEENMDQHGRLGRSIESHGKQDILGQLVAEQEADEREQVCRARANPSSRSASRGAYKR